MNNILNIKTPAHSIAKVLKSEYGLENHGLTNQYMVYWNLPNEALYEEIIFRGEGNIVNQGALVVNTGFHTARSASDKYIVRESSSENEIWWGDYNCPISSEKFNEIYARLLGFLQGKDLFVQDCLVCSHQEYEFPIRVITEYAWHSLFARNMFLSPASVEALHRHIPQFTVVCVPSFQAHPPIDSIHSKTFIILNFEQRLCIIGNTAYGGEIKKSVFTLLNYLLPKQGVMPMHCSANIGISGDVALFFGLSGTGKTSLSADPTRNLIGDDEHGWGDDGVFNFEGGCYAKVIRLSPTAEPDIYACTRSFGTILENVVYESTTRTIDLDDDQVTENTRASYPLDYIRNSIQDKKGGHPKNIILLTCDASGVMPPIAKLTPEQAIYHFVSGYTSKVAGTEIGLGKEPEITFSTCFGAPFMVFHPSIYADLLYRKILRYEVNCWLINTGWVGGPYGIGKRISIQDTRTILNAALSSLLSDIEYFIDPVFGFLVPKSCPGIANEVLNPANAWQSEESYLMRYRELARRFVDNFKKYEGGLPDAIRTSGPYMGISQR